MTDREHQSPLLPAACREAQAALEAELVSGGALDAEQAEALDAHLSACPDCASFVEISRRLGALPSTMSEVESLRSVRAAGATYFNRKRQRRTVRAIGAVVAAVAAALVLGLASVLYDRGEAVGPGPAPGGRVALLDGRVTLFSDAQSTLETIVDTENDMQVRLSSGFLCARVAPDAEPRVRFRVETKLGTVTVKGTVFGVTVSDTGGRVDVIRGEVQVETAGDRAVFAVGGGSGFDFGSRRIAPIGADTERRILTGLDIALESDIAPPGGAKTTASQAASTPDAAVEAPPHMDADTGPRALKPSLKTLLKEAAQCRLEKAWRCAANRYTAIIKRFPGSAEATTALVTLGEIQLRHLDRPGDARRHFQRYHRQRPSGPLSEQALFGIAKAGRALGDSRGEEQALERFLASHPSSPMAPRARQRLDQLQKK